MGVVDCSDVEVGVVDYKSGVSDDLTTSAQLQDNSLSTRSTNKLRVYPGMLPMGLQTRSSMVSIEKLRRIANVEGCIL